MTQAARTARTSDGNRVGFVSEEFLKGPTAPDHPILLQPRPGTAGRSSGPVSTDGSEPVISVVVAAHLRPDFIVGAVESVLRTGLNPDQLDIVVTKGYRSPEQEKVLANLGARVYHDYDVGVGLQLWRALPLTRAPLVAFLDDDDQFEPSRLDHVVRIFDDRPDIGFYRNRVKLVDLDNKPVPLALYEPLELDSLLDRTGPLDRLSVSDPSSFRLLRKCHPWFNMSSMAVRRTLWTGPFGPLLATAHHAPDVRLYLIALLSGTGIYMDDQRLTRYRTSSPNWTAQAARAADDLDSVTTTARLAQEYAPSPWPSEFWIRVRDAEKRALWSEFLSELEKGRPRVEVLSAFMEYLDFLLRHPRAMYPEPSRAFYAAVLATYLTVPSLGNAILTRASTMASINRTRRRTGSIGPPSLK